MIKTFPIPEFLLTFFNVGSVFLLIEFELILLIKH